METVIHTSGSEHTIIAGLISSPKSMERQRDVQAQVLRTPGPSASTTTFSESIGVQLRKIEQVRGHSLRVGTHPTSDRQTRCPEEVSLRVPSNLPRDLGKPVGLVG